MTSVSGTHVFVALEKFWVDAGGVPPTFHSDFDKSSVVASPFADPQEA